MIRIPVPENTSERFEIGVKGRYRSFVADIEAIAPTTYSHITTTYLHILRQIHLITLIKNSKLDFFLIKI